LKQYQDTDYLHASTRVRTLETRMLDRRDLQKMIECRNFDEAFKVLNDAGIAVGRDPADFEEGLAQSLDEAYTLVEKIAPEKELFSIFRYRYDGHNLKTLIKSRRTHGEYDQILSGLGNVPAKTLKTEFENGRFEKLCRTLAEAAEAADESLAKTGDPQAVDIIVDRAVLEAMAAKAAEFDFPFLTDYVTAYIDMANLRSAVRIKRMGKDVFFLRRVLAAGGRVDRGRLTDAFAKGMEEILSVISLSPYEKALEPSFDLLRSGGALTQFERACDNYLVALLARSKLVAYGAEPVIAYLYAKESEVRAARIVLTSKAAGVAPAQITERLRDTLC